jgi:hypothetical protein
MLRPLFQIMHLTLFTFPFSPFSSGNQLTETGARRYVVANHLFEVLCNISEDVKYDEHMDPEALQVPSNKKWRAIRGQRFANFQCGLRKRGKALVLSYTPITFPIMSLSSVL